jgi:DUF1680 family protein
MLGYINFIISITMYRRNGIYSAILLIVLLMAGLFIGFRIDSNESPGKAATVNKTMVYPAVKDVKINDSFWSPKLHLWNDVTVNDIFNKFEGGYDVESQSGLLNDFKKKGRTQNAFRNFDIVAEGKRGVGGQQHEGPPWYDGLVYETIRGASDFLVQFPDKKTEEKIDAYIGRIEAAQNSEGDGYINTYTMLAEPQHRWGLNGGFERYQHDVYNSGALMEAAVHYYNATGKTRLLNVAVKCANYICKVIGPAPKLNIIPGHALPEEAIMKLYWLFRNNPVLKSKMSEKVNEDEYYAMAQFWIENRGNNCGLPVWNVWSQKECEKWIKDNTYSDPKYGDHSRPSWGSYNQDSVSVFQQKTIEGHAVRATLFGTGVTTVALENRDPRYVEASSALWDNMVGRRMYITGGCGSFRYEEMFGPDYVLPSDGYLETCAAVGSVFFSGRMAELHGEGKYFDAFERTLYNNVLSGISLSGDHYTYENPLVGKGIKRWNWHGCPCCPPMFLKIVGELPRYIYSKEGSSIYINLFIGSEAKIALDNSQEVLVKQTTRYPWEGHIVINIEPKTEKEFTVKVRIPGWAQGTENPYGLYLSKVKSEPGIKVNGKKTTLKTVNGYVNITRIWAKGDIIELDLPMEPRVVYANEKVENLKGMVALASGPIVYGLEEVDNPELNSCKIEINSQIKMTYKNEVLNGVNIITGEAFTAKGLNVQFTAVPFSTLNNRMPGNAFKVWMPVQINY